MSYIVSPDGLIHVLLRQTYKEVEVACWKRYGETWTDDATSQKRIICKDADKYILVSRVLPSIINGSVISLMNDNIFAGFNVYRSR